MTGFFRDGCCNTSPEDLGSHTICAVMTAEFLEHQRSIGNDLITPDAAVPVPRVVPGDRWCVTARNWLRAHMDGAAAPVCSPPPTSGRSSSCRSRCCNSTRSTCRATSARSRG